MTALEQGRADTGLRVLGYDAFRGLAILVMVVDHVTLLSGGPNLIRDTLGRLAMPMFFLLAGHLVRRPKLRHLGIAGVGVLLPVVVPWIDSPNVLVWWALGVVVIWGVRWATVWGELGDRDSRLWVLIAIALTTSANGWVQTDGTYDGRCLIALMALGSMLPATTFTWAARAPHWVAAVGSRPVSVYVGHLLLLEALVLVS